MNHTLLKRPVITEKSVAMAQNQNVYTFEVDRLANKAQIKSLIEELYGVHVLDINTIRKYRVKKATGRKRLSSLAGLTKKALVHLQPGETIELFDLTTARN